MSRQVGVVKFDLGERHSDIIVKDIRIWTNSNKTTADEANNVEQNFDIWSYSGRFLQYVDLWSLPLWLQPRWDHKIENSIFNCYTMSKATMAYFSAKLKDERRGIVIYFETHSEDDSGIWIFFKNDTGDQVQCYPLDFHKKKLIDDQIKTMSEAQDTTISRRDSGIDEILNKTKKRINITNKEVAKNIRINDKKLQFNETLSKLILGGLRLRGIPNTQSSFQRLYKMTFDASEFTYRDELKKLSKGVPAEIPFEALQETVEILLRLFTRS